MPELCVCVCPCVFVHICLRVKGRVACCEFKSVCVCVCVFTCASSPLPSVHLSNLSSGSVEKGEYKMKEGEKKGRREN